MLRYNYQQHNFNFNAIIIHNNYLNFYDKMDNLEDSKNILQIELAEYYKLFIQPTNINQLKESMLDIKCDLFEQEELHLDYLNQIKISMTKIKQFQFSDYLADNQDEIDEGLSLLEHILESL